MLIGHLPAGYLAAKATKLSGAMFAGFILGSVAPDFDMLWFYFVDGRGHHHHDYLTHRPLIWALILVAGCLTKMQFLIGVGTGGIFHMCLDSIAGKITWGWPIWDHATTLVTVQATHSHWILSFAAHWTFRLELAITAIAMVVLWQSHRGRQ